MSISRRHLIELIGVVVYLTGIRLADYFGWWGLSDAFCLLLNLLLGILLLDDFGFQEAHPARQIGWGFAGALLLILVGCGGILLLPYLCPQAEAVLFPELEALSIGRCLGMLLRAVLVACSEELLCRGVLLARMTELCGREWAGIWGSGLLLGLLGLLTTGGVWQALWTLVFGVAMGYAYRKLHSCSMFSLILAHTLYNLFAWNCMLLRW